MFLVTQNLIIIDLNSLHIVVQVICPPLLHCTCDEYNDEYKILIKLHHKISHSKINHKKADR